MFRNTFQSGFLSVLYSIGSKPLQIWDKKGASLRLAFAHRPIPRTRARALASSFA